ncbi:MAG TPA: 50S ribosomal protein L11 methyltransferase [Tissierellaceae bacterium]|jgi:ribosomal protein L11 methyltransferase|nr:50S ribosomal protein L11 methyltransferase [Tissierellaceae bacterium]
MNWLEVIIKTKPENEDLVSSILYDNGATGLTIEDPNDIVELDKAKDAWDFIEPELLKKKDDGIIIKAYYSEAEDLEGILEKIRERIKNQGLGEILTSKVDESDWAENWKIHYKTTKIGANIVIKPSWEEYQPERDDIVIELDPGMAFGTGSHETTVMCAKALERNVESTSTVFDVGCGSGILGIIAAKLGAGRVLAIDLDPMCIKVTKENAIINQVDDTIQVEQGNLLHMVEEKADVIVANIIAEIIVDLVPGLRNHLNDNGIFIASGIIESKLDKVKEALMSSGYEIVDVELMNGWAAVTSRMVI